MTGGVVTSIVIVLIVVTGITIAVVSYFRLQRHRADAAAVEGYRRLAERIEENQRELDQRLREVSDRVRAVEELLRAVD